MIPHEIMSGSTGARGQRPHALASAPQLPPPQRLPCILQLPSCSPAARAYLFFLSCNLVIVSLFEPAVGDC